MSRILNHWSLFSVISFLSQLVGRISSFCIGLFLLSPSCILSFISMKAWFLIWKKKKLLNNPIKYLGNMIWPFLFLWETCYGFNQARYNNSYNKKMTFIHNNVAKRQSLYNYSYNKLKCFNLIQNLFEIISITLSLPLAWRNFGL